MSTAPTSAQMGMNAAWVRLGQMTVHDLDCLIPEGHEANMRVVVHPEFGTTLAGLSREVLAWADGSLDTPYQIEEEDGLFFLPLDEERVDAGLLGRDELPLRYLLFTAEGRLLEGPEFGQDRDGEMRVLWECLDATVIVARAQPGHATEDELSTCTALEAAELYNDCTPVWLDPLGAGHGTPDAHVVDDSEPDAPDII